MPEGRNFERVRHYEKFEGIGTRTPIRFGAAVEKIARLIMPSFVLQEAQNSERHLLYLYSRHVIKEWTGFILIQGARRAGRLTAELAICRRPVYPLYLGRCRPFLAVDGVRERCAVLHEQDDQWWEYRAQDTLEDRLRDLMSEISTRGFFVMDDKFGPLLRQEIERTERLVKQWHAQEAQYHHRPVGSRFPDLMMEAQAYEYIRQVIQYDSFTRVLGPLMQRYAEEGWVSCQTWLMSMLMETGNLDELQEFFTGAADIADDEVHIVTGRVPPYVYLKPPESFEERMKVYAYFKSLSMTEAFYDEVKGTTP